MKNKKWLGIFLSMALFITVGITFGTQVAMAAGVPENNHNIALRISESSLFPDVSGPVGVPGEVPARHESDVSEQESGLSGPTDSCWFSSLLRFYLELGLGMEEHVIAGHVWRLGFPHVFR